MITINSPSTQTRYNHTLSCKKSIGSFVARQQNYPVVMMKCHGRIYKPDRDENGKFLDMTGVADYRIMVMSTADDSYCCATPEQLDEAFDEI